MINEDFKKFIETILEQINLHLDFAKKSECDVEIVTLHEQFISHLESLTCLSTERELQVNYTNQFKNEINNILKHFPYRNQKNDSFITESSKLSIKQSIETNSKTIGEQLKLIKFNFDFFHKLGFFNNNIVAIGANGSGKTTLSNELKKYLPKNGVVISAQKVLVIPTFSGISNFNKTQNKLTETQTADKTLKTTFSTENNGNAYQILVRLGGEFQVLLDNLLAERSAIRNKFCDALQDGGKDSKVPTTRLDTALKIWNSLIKHRVIECNDGINITLKPKTTSPYPAHQMSDGEKVVLYLIAQILQAPPSGFIIVDEPEMYLHKTILKKLWDILEKERQDCIFVYLTHDLDFASSRTTAKKVWIKSFTHPNIWEIEDIPDNELPQTLLLELIGSQKNILFCEGEKGSNDEKLFNLLFPNYTIAPVASCFDVINYTKAFNKLPIRLTNAVGIIDSDHHVKERLDALKSKSIYSFSMSEIENLFLDEEFLAELAKQILIDKGIVNDIKADIIEQLRKDLELQVSNFVSSKINYYFKDSHVSKGNDLSAVNNNFNRFTNEIKIQEWYDERKAYLLEIIDKKNYKEALSVFNNKGLQAIVNKRFKITDFIDRATRLIQYDSNTHKYLIKYFPNEIWN